MSDFNYFNKPMNYKMAYCRECNCSFNINTRPDGFCSDKCEKNYMIINKLKLI